MRLVDLLNRIIWDRKLNPSDFVLVCYDRVLGRNVEMSFSKVESISPGFLVTRDGTSIPIHRIRKVLKNGILLYSSDHAKNIQQRISAKGIDPSGYEWEYSLVKLDRINVGDEIKVDRASIDFQKRVILAGRAEPILVVDGKLVEGLARYLAYRELGLDEAPAYIGRRVD